MCAAGPNMPALREVPKYLRSRPAGETYPARCCRKPRLWDRGRQLGCPLPTHLQSALVSNHSTQQQQHFCRRPLARCWLGCGLRVRGGSSAGELLAGRASQSQKRRRRLRRRSPTPLSEELSERALRASSGRERGALYPKTLSTEFATSRDLWCGAAPVSSRSRHDGKQARCTEQL